MVFVKILLKLEINEKIQSTTVAYVYFSIYLVCNPNNNAQKETDASFTLSITIPSIPNKRKQDLSLSLLSKNQIPDQSLVP